MKKDINDIEVVSEIVSPLHVETSFYDHKQPIMPFDIVGEIHKSTGESTRIVDRCIQEFFNNGVTYVYRGRGKSFMRLHEKVCEIFDLRMNAEHPNVVYNMQFKEIDSIWCYVITKIND